MYSLAGSSQERWFHLMLLLLFDGHRETTLPRYLVVRLNKLLQWYEFLLLRFSGCRIWCWWWCSWTILFTQYPLTQESTTTLHGGCGDRTTPQSLWTELTDPKFRSILCECIFLIEYHLISDLKFFSEILHQPWIKQ